MTVPVRTLVQVAIFACVVIVCVSFLAWCEAVKTQKRDLVVARETGKALESVARQEPVIRQDQKEKQDAAREIPGSDTRLPDGYGRDLERVRQREHNPNP